MSKVYTKGHTINKKKLGKRFGIVLFLFGISTILYIFYPMLYWQLFEAPVFAEQNIHAPIPTATLVTKSSLSQFLQVNPLLGPDYSNAANWYPDYHGNAANTATVSEYTLSIPALNITNAIVSTKDNDLGSHLVNYQGTAIPPNKGNTVVFGHSTLKWLFDPKNYHTIFAHADEIKVGDEILPTVNNITYHYKVESIIVVNPTDMSVLAQTDDDSYLTVITCTPPGTTLYRLVIKARLEHI